LPTCVRYTAYVLRSGDTLLQKPVRVADARGVMQQAQQYSDTRSRRLNLATAEEVANEWVRNAPNQARALNALAQILAARGDAQQARALLRRTEPTGSLFEEMRRFLLRMETELKAGDGKEAIRIYDSVRAANGPLPGAGTTTVRMGNAISAYGMAFGRVAEFDSLLGRNLTQQNAPPVVGRYNFPAVRAMLSGVPSDSLAALERELFDFTRTNRGSIAATRAIVLTMQYALRMPRATWPALDTTIRDLKLQPAMALARGDTAAVRRAARSMDSVLTVIYTTFGNDTGYTLVAAEAYLALRDTTAALRTLRYGLDTAMATAQYFPMQGGGFTPGYTAPRIMLLRADLAAARGLKDEARLWYKRFIDAWSTAAPELQPVVARARASYAGVGGT
jgi:tetratricopeptide (TPR) repeat protein